MFISKRMLKVQIVGPETHLAKVIEVLYQLKLLHLLDHKKTEALDIGTPLADAEQFSALLVKTRSLVSSFSLPASEDVTKEIDSLPALEKQLHSIADTHQELQEKYRQLQTILGQKKELLQQLQLLDALSLSVDALQPYHSLASFIGIVKKEEGLSAALASPANSSHYTTAFFQGRHYVAVFVPKKDADSISKTLQAFGYQPVSFSDLSSYRGNPAEESRKLALSLTLLEKDLQHFQTALQKFELQHGSFLRSAEHFLQVALEKAHAPLRFGETRHAFFIEGWVSKEQYHSLSATLEKYTEQKISVTVQEIKKSDKVPIFLQNLFFVKPFEFFLYLYTLPKYNELDPSFFLFFSFPFFFGLMLGDVGYGLVTLLLFALLWWKMPKARSLVAALLLSSVVTIAFGLAFGEYFGFEHVSEETGKLLVEQYGLPLHPEVLEHGGETVYSFPRILNRLHGETTLLGTTVPTVLVLGAIFGFIHVNLGLFLGFINEVVSHGFKQAFFAKISWYVLELGVAIAALSSAGLLSLHWVFGLGFILLATVLLFVGEGVQGILEIPAIFTNILSYLRLGAVGLASVGFAVVINESLAMPLIEKGGIFLLIGILILIFGHVINIALGILGPFLHSLRLHYVEFFSKFYKGGGIPFHAFGEERERL